MGDTGGNKMSNVKDVHKPEPRKGAIGKIKDVVTPQPKTEAEAREQYMVKKYRLKKDPAIPHRYWIDDKRYITFIPGDEESVEAAERALDTLFRAPSVETVTTADTPPVSPYAKKPGQKGGSGSGIMAELRKAADELEPITRSAHRASTDLLSGDLGFDPKKAEKQLMSTDGVVPVRTPEYKDFTGDGTHTKSPSKRKKRTTKTNEDDFGMGELREPRSEDFLK